MTSARDRASPRSATSPRPATPKTDLPPLEVGDRVRANGHRACVKYVGSAHFAEGRWVGVELSVPKGKNDGAVQGVRYFECPENCGVFLREEKVERIPVERRGERPKTEPAKRGWNVLRQEVLSDPTPPRRKSLAAGARRQSVKLSPLDYLKVRQQEAEERRQEQELVEGQERDKALRARWAAEAAQATKEVEEQKQQAEARQAEEAKQEAEEQKQPRPVAPRAARQAAASLGASLLLGAAEVEAERQAAARASAGAAVRLALAQPAVVAEQHEVRGSSPSGRLDRGWSKLGVLDDSSEDEMDGFRVALRKDAELGIAHESLAASDELLVQASGDIKREYGSTALSAVPWADSPPTSPSTPGLGRREGRRGTLGLSALSGGGSHWDLLRSRLNDAKGRSGSARSSETPAWAKAAEPLDARKVDSEAETTAEATPLRSARSQPSTSRTSSSSQREDDDDLLAQAMKIRKKSEALNGLLSQQLIDETGLAE